jgi:hypothetical protein
MSNLLPSSNDIKLSARDVLKHFVERFGPIPDEGVEFSEKILAQLVYENPPTGPEEGPCNHGYENKYWCARCQGKLDENFRPIEGAA